MTTDRPYRKARSADEALQEMEACSGTQFDPDVVAALAVVVLRG
jgi:HD-GYP domain-containing protein (c-di-GMP phosphodiesterase class II)